MTPRPRQAGVIDRSGQAEVGDLHPLDPVLQKDVGRLDVAMDQSLGMGRGQARSRLHADPQDLLQVQAGRCGRCDRLSDTPATYCMTM